MKTNVMYFHTSDHHGPKILTQADDYETAARYMREIAIRPAGATIIETSDSIDVYCEGYGFSYFLEADRPAAEMTADRKAEGLIVEIVYKSSATADAQALAASDTKYAERYSENAAIYAGTAKEYRQRLIDLLGQEEADRRLAAAGAKMEIFGIVAQPAKQGLLTPEQERQIANLIAAGTPHRRAIRIVITGSYGTGLLLPETMRRLGRVIARYEADHNLAPAA